MPIISLGIINKKILFAVISGLFKLIANTILYHSDAKMKAHPCILGINSGLGLMLAVIPHIYSILRTFFELVNFMFISCNKGHL